MSGEVSEYVDSFERDASRLDALAAAMVAIVGLTNGPERAYVLQQFEESVKQSAPQHKVAQNILALLDDEEKARLVKIYGPESIEP